MYFCIHNCTSPSNDYAAMACGNNNQAQLHTHISVPFWSPDVWLGLELLRGIQFRLPAILNNSLASYQSVATIITCVMNAARHWKWVWPPKNFRAPVNSLLQCTMTSYCWVTRTVHDYSSWSHHHNQPELLPLSIFFNSWKCIAYWHITEVHYRSTNYMLAWGNLSISSVAKTSS